MDQYSKSFEKDTPEVSVILPFYNAESTLHNSANSILNQSFKNFELLLIDNNSSDKSHSIAKHLAKLDSRIKLYREEQQGVVFAMNLGLKKSRGKFISRMDSDDIAYTDKLEKQVTFLHHNPQIGFTGCHVKYVAHNKNTEGFERFVKRVNCFYSSIEIDINRFIDIPIINPTIMFRREIYEKLGGCLDGDFPEDYEMQLRFLEAGVKMQKVNETLLDWHDYSSRLTRNDLRYSAEAFFNIKARYFKNWSEKNNIFHPNIWIWGAGRKTRQRVKSLEKEDLIIDGYIDIKRSKMDAVYYENIESPGKFFIVSMVTNTGAGDQVRKFLQNKGFTEGIDFILMG